MSTFNHVEAPELVPLETIETTNERYYILPDDTKVPSVTTFLGHFKRQRLAEWRKRVGNEEANKISSQAARRGTKIHNLVEKYLNNEPEQEFLGNSMPDIKQMFNDIRPVVDRINNIRHLEAPLYSRSMRLAGRVDCIADFDGILSVIDFKTARKEKREEHIEDYFLQATAYAMMYFERTSVKIDQIVIIIASDSTPEPQVFVKDMNNYWDRLCTMILLFHKQRGKK